MWIIINLASASTIFTIAVFTICAESCIVAEINNFSELLFPLFTELLFGVRIDSQLTILSELFFQHELSLIGLIQVYTGI